MAMLSGDKKMYTCREVYEEGAALLAQLEDGRLDARLLLEHFCGIGTDRLLAEPDRQLTGEQREAFLKGAGRRAAREPLAYITGEQYFMGLPFRVSEDVLIPEQDTENLVEEALRLIDDGSRILDLCTGSGCILLSLLRYTNGCSGVGTDISGKAIEIARKNAAAIGVEDCVRWAQGDLFSALESLPRNSLPVNALTDCFRQDDGEPGSSCGTAVQEGEPGSNGGTADQAGEPGDSGLSFTARETGKKAGRYQFDLIISNPPYIPTEVIGTLAPEVSCAQPRLALDGGADGLDFYRRIIREAPDHLVIGGRLMLEIGYDQARAVSTLLREAGYYAVEILQDYGGNDRVATAVCSLSQKKAADM